MPTAPTTNASSQIDQICEKVERLLLRYEELQRTNGLLQAQIETLGQDRDSLKSRLGAARARLDVLLERLPAHGVANTSDLEAAPEAHEPRTEDPS
ncbi:MAG: DUF904 domain-containing protein [Burkholderiales bacterium]